MLLLPLELVEEDDDVDEDVSLLEVVLLSDLLVDDASELELDEDDDAAGPLAEELDERESVMYQPLPLKTMPTGWMILRRAPPHCSQVVRGGSEKLWRFSITSLQAVQV